ncbi:hypothetical protein CPB83DRAFT_898993 [Crepidotus variabilis]|uniref:DUF3533 domain-containing protein n=1 Tax=Crepidotus variabilis TaxID=179855 RepID=A0A9P6JJU7_9AGAR|nr:hypothetical protein CPB83DRAFT_898993 [Crepidotus variabilis]
MDHLGPSNHTLVTRTDKDRTFGSGSLNTTSSTPLPTPGTVGRDELDIERAFSTSLGARTASTSLAGTTTSTLLGFGMPAFSHSFNNSFQTSRSLQPLIHPPTSPTQSPLMFSKYFWDRGDPELERARAIYFRAYFVGLGAIIVTIFVVFSIYWGSLWHVPDHALQGWVIDFDGGDIGQAVTDGLINTRSWTVHWKPMAASRFPNGHQDIIDAIIDQETTWVAITINSGASSTLQDALYNPSPTYNSSAAISVYAAEARNENAFRNIIRPAVQATLDLIKTKYAIKAASDLASAANGTVAENPTINISTLLAVSPEVIVSPIGYTIVNLIPFNQPVASAVVFVGLIYLLILSFYIVMIAHGAREASGVNRILTTKSLISLRMTSSALGYLLLSFFYSLLNLAFKLNVSHKYGRAGFLVFWMLQYIGMLSVGLALESLITILTARWIPFFMILWIIVDVSVCIFPLDVLPRIYNYGYAAPFYNISKSVRSVVFGTKNTRTSSKLLIIERIA